MTNSDIKTKVLTRKASKTVNDAREALLMMWLDLADLQKSATAADSGKHAMIRQSLIEAIDGLNKARDTLFDIA